ncbi:MAG TPA: serine protease [Ideonella sp.]|uniref:S1 family peptidase n=1 Tax=Ideonella sp. TaxID=1929293 RepID=UPI002E334F7E|nr:serine protease [Ideonella sp.]HEX5687555.1 serine protease [Ideonella sp.]
MIQIAKRARVARTGQAAAMAALGIATTLIATSATAQEAARAANPERARVEALLATVPQPQQLPGTEAPMVVDGKPAKPGKWPFMVSLVSKSNSNNYDAHFCGGSLIDDNNVLTAAHCVQGAQPGSIQVLVGTQSLIQGGRRINVTRVTVHPNFGATPFLQADVAVLRLAENVTDIKPVTYASSTSVDDNVSPDNDRTTVMGWGALEWNQDGPEVLYQAPLIRNTIAECNALSFYGGKLTNNNVCAGDLTAPGKSACYGDSGGPLVGRNDAGKTVQIGVVSGGPRVCGDVPGYFARVGSYATWIKQQVDMP